MKSHIQLQPREEYAKAIVCGSPERAAWFSSLLENAKPLAKNREYHSYLGTFRGQPLLVTSHGVGSAGAAICFQELIDAGVRKAIRIGTAGGLYKETKIGDIVVPAAAVRNDGVSAQMLPPEYPAIADPVLFSGITRQLQTSGTPHRSGIILTSDLFYPGPLATNLQFYSDANVIAVEMECSTLFIVAAVRKISAAALVVLDGSPLQWSEGNYDPDPKRLEPSLKAAFYAAAETLVAST